MVVKPSDSDSSYHCYQGSISPTSTTLIVRIKEGEPEGWNRFMRLYAPLIRRWCKKPGGRLTRQDRQDITQEVLIKVGRAVTDFDLKRESRSFRAWLRTITQNSIVDFLEKKERRRPVSLLMSDTGHFKETHYQPFELPENEPEEKAILIRQVLKTLKSQFSDRDWEIVNLFVNAEKTSSEVAEVMGMNGETVRRIKNRILSRIRDELLIQEAKLDI